MMAITKAQVMAGSTAFGIIRGVMDEIKPCEGDESAQADQIAFEETMAALEKKGGTYNG